MRYPTLNAISNCVSNSNAEPRNMLKKCAISLFVAPQPFAILYGTETAHLNICLEIPNFYSLGKLSRIL